MSQWGLERTVRGEKTTIRVLPHVYTGKYCFAKARPESKVDLLLLLDVHGDEAEADALLSDLQRAYVGQDYASWLSAA